MTAKQLQFWTLLQQIQNRNTFVNQDSLTWVLCIFYQVLSNFRYQVNSVLNLMRFKFNVRVFLFWQVLIFKIRISKDFLIIIPYVKYINRELLNAFSITQMHRWPLVKIESVFKNITVKQWFEWNTFFQHDWNLFVEELGRYIIVLICDNVFN